MIARPHHLFPILPRLVHRASHVILALGLVCAALSSARAQSGVILDFNLAAVPNSPVPTFAPTTVAAGLESNGLSRGPGVAATNLTGGYSAGGWTAGPLGDNGPSRANAIASNRYLGFNLVVGGRYLASLDSVWFSLRRSAVNAPLYFELQYSLDGFVTPGVKVADFTFRARVSGSSPTLPATLSENPEDYFRFGAPERADEEGFVLPPDPGPQIDTTTTPGRPVPPMDLSTFADLQNIPGGTTVSFRLYAWGNGSTATSNTVAFGRVNGPQITGEVIVDPNLGNQVVVDLRSPVANVTPEAGIYTVASGSTFTTSASVLDLGASREVPIGWAGTGSVTDGTGSTATFNVTEASVFTWQWKRENRLSVQTTGMGLVRVRSTDRYPLIGFDFTGWRALTEENLAAGDRSNLTGVESTFSAPGFAATTLVRGSGLNAADLTAGALSSSNWNGTPAFADAVANNKYIEFSLAPQAAGPVEVNSLFVPYRYTATGPHSIALVYSFDGFATSSLVESLRIQDQASGTQFSSHLFRFPADPRLRDLTETVTFRIYAWGGTGTGVGTFAPYNLNGPGRLDMILYGGIRTETDVASSADLWRDQESLLELEAIPASGHVFTGWSGPRFHNDPLLAGLDLSAPLSITANFAASAADGIPDAWRQFYFGANPVDAGSDADNDGFTVRDEYLRGTDPTTPDVLIASDGIALAAWENTQRDPELAGQWVVRDFGGGFRGVWENSNHSRSALTPFRPDGQSVTSVDHTSHDGPRILLRNELWQAGWSEATLSAVISVGDNDGVNVYFRYVDELNWYRVTICGEDGATSRPRLGISVEKRENGQYSRLAFDNSMATDPADSSYFKRVRVEIDQAGSDFTIRVQGWDVLLDPPAYNPNLGATIQITDEAHPVGRAGLGTWAMGDFVVEPPVVWNPVTSGALFESFVITLNDTTVYADDWATAPEGTTLPADWSSVFTDALAGDWRSSVHGSLFQSSAAGAATTGTLAAPRANADGPALIGPALGASTYVIDAGLHVFGTGSVGVIFDYADNNNYGRVLFSNSFARQNGVVPSGVSIGRKVNGVWNEAIAGDLAFVPSLARPFRLSLSRAGSTYVLNVQEPDRPETARRWSWTDSLAAPAGDRVGFTTWRAVNAHFDYLDVYGVASADSELAITNITIEGSEIVLTVHNPSGQPYYVQSCPDLVVADWQTVATDRTGSEWRTPLPVGPSRVFWRLAR